MEEITVELRIFSPRWGHEDIYKLELKQNSLVITQGARSTKATWRENLDPEWNGETLEDILRNDSIYPPGIFQDLIEHAWLSWRNGELDSAAVDEELQALAKWLNDITNSKPRSEYWNKYF